MNPFGARADARTPGPIGASSGSGPERGSVDRAFLRYQMSAMANLPLGIACSSWPEREGAAYLLSVCSTVWYINRV